MLHLLQLQATSRQLIAQNKLIRFKLFRLSYKVHLSSLTLLMVVSLRCCVIYLGGAGVSRSVVPGPARLPPPEPEPRELGAGKERDEIYYMPSPSTKLQPTQHWEHINVCFQSHKLYEASTIRKHDINSKMC